MLGRAHFFLILSGLMAHMGLMKLPLVILVALLGSFMGEQGGIMKNRTSMFVVAAIAGSILFGAGILPLSGKSYASTPQIPAFAVRSKIP